MRVWNKLRREKKGQALVEFALVLPLLLLLLMTIFEFGNIFYSYLLITAASREGARMGVVGNNDTEIIQRVQEICSTLDTEQLTVEIVPENTANRYRGVPLQVEVDYDVYLITPMLSTFLPDPFLLKARSVMRIE